MGKSTGKSEMNVIKIEDIVAGYPKSHSDSANEVAQLSTCEFHVGVRRPDSQMAEPAPTITQEQHLFDLRKLVHGVGAPYVCGGSYTPNEPISIQIGPMVIPFTRETPRVCVLTSCHFVFIVRNTSTH
jgi:hypothetical protein